MKFYLMVSGVKMMNSYFALVFPCVIMTLGVFFVRQVITSIPGELLEAATTRRRRPGADSQNDGLWNVSAKNLKDRNGLRAIAGLFPRNLD
jgi:hypothetical protein